MAGGSRLHANYDAALLKPSFAGFLGAGHFQS